MKFFPTLFPGTPNNATDAGPAWTTLHGINNVPFTSADASAAAAPVTSAPPANTHLVIDDLIVSTDTALTLTFTEETSGTVLRKIYLPENYTGNIVTRGKFKLPTAAKRLQVQASAAGNISVEALYHFELQA